MPTNPGLLPAGPRAAVRFLILVAGLLGQAGCQSAPPLAASAAGANDPAASACAKADALWNEQILPSRYAELPPLVDVGLLDFAAVLDPSFALKALTHPGDTMEAGRRKRIHAFGAEARLRLEAISGDQPYTGVFAEGTACAIGRFSLADKPTGSSSVPALAIKIFLDGTRPSVNLHLMYSVDGQTGHDFFANEFSNVLPPARTFATRQLDRSFRGVAETFGALDTNPGRLTLDHVAAVHADGTPVAEPVAPYRLVLRPTEAARALMPGAAPSIDFRRELARLPPGTAIYDVYAFADAGDRSSADAGQRIGRLIVTSPVVSSRYGDESLYFQHHMQQRPTPR